MYHLSMRMFRTTVNRKLLPLKMNFFFTAACIGPVVGFLPTIAKQLGYSLTTYGVTMTFMSVFATVLAPAVCIAVDRFRVRKRLFVTGVTGIGVIAFSFLYVPAVPPADPAAQLECDRPTWSTDATVFHVKRDANGLPRSTSAADATVAAGRGASITCQLNCRATQSNGKRGAILNEPNDRSYRCDGDDWMTVNGTGILYEHDRVDVTFGRKDDEQVSGAFPVMSARIDGGAPVPSTVCRCRSRTFCRIVSCTDDAVTGAATAKSFRGNVLGLYQFWIFFVVVTTLWSCFVTTTALQNPICLDILGDRTEDFGKQKCWTSFGWGFFSIFIGWLVDLCSAGKTEKDYSPVFYSCVALTACNLAATSKLQVIETKSEGKWKSVYGLFAKPSAIAFYVWSALNTFFHTIITHFLFWYMEDLVSANNDPRQRAWIKTLQGLAQGIQCFGGEIPFFFWSGWIIKKMGHCNCMAVVVGAMAVRMYLYTVIWNPAWIILIELLNGVSFALGYSVTMSYAKTISPPDTLSTVIGLIGLVNCFGESLASLLGGYLFDSYGGVWSFRFFAYNSALVCGLTILSNFFGLMRRMENFGN